MNENTLNLRNKAIEKFRMFAILLQKEGALPHEIERSLRNHIDVQIRSFYNYKKGVIEHIGSEISAILKLKDMDSKAEYVFGKIMDDNFIRYEFQYKIGPYRADYLIADDLVVELDGPQHNKEYDKQRDAYLEKMGYRVLRIPIWVAATVPDAAIEIIKEMIACAP